MAGEQKLEKANLEKLPLSTNPTEKIISPEIKTESIALPLEKKIEPKTAAEVTPANKTTKIQPIIGYQQKRAQEIDNILSEGLNEVFLKMKPEEQKIFKAKGEETARKINDLLGQAKVKINKIVALIRGWLLLITGINKFFLEQEVKIKTDKILRLKDK